VPGIAIFVMALGHPRSFNLRERKEKLAALPPARTLKEGVRVKSVAKGVTELIPTCATRISSTRIEGSVEFDVAATSDIATRGSCESFIWVNKSKEGSSKNKSMVRGNFERRIEIAATRKQTVDRSKQHKRDERTLGAKLRSVVDSDSVNVWFLDAGEVRQSGTSGERRYNGELM